MAPEKNTGIVLSKLLSLVLPPNRGAGLPAEDFSYSAYPLPVAHGPVCW